MDFPFKMAQAMSFAEAGAPGREISGAWTGPREQIATKKQPSKKFAPFFFEGGGERSARSAQRTRVARRS